jgi:hypothetical protein
MPPRQTVLPALAVLMTTAALSACTSPKDVETTFAPRCPRAQILADAADLTRYRMAASHDLTDMVLDGRITGVQGQCARGDDGQLNTTIRAGVTLTRGPAAQGRDAMAPMFVAVVRDGKVLDKAIYRLEAAFPSNTDQVQLVSNDVQLTLPVGPKLTGPDYSVYVGFQLTPDELAANRKRGPR